MLSPGPVGQTGSRPSVGGAAAQLPAGPGSLFAPREAVKAFCARCVACPPTITFPDGRTQARTVANCLAVSCPFYGIRTGGVSRPDTLRLIERKCTRCQLCGLPEWKTWWEDCPLRGHFYA